MSEPFGKSVGMGVKTRPASLIGREEAKAVSVVVMPVTEHGPIRLADVDAQLACIVKIGV